LRRIEEYLEFFLGQAQKSHERRECALIAGGVTYSFDPSTYLFGLLARLNNGSSARFNNTASQTPNPGEDITQLAVGLAYSF